MNGEWLYQMLSSASPNGDEIAWQQQLIEKLNGQVDEIYTDECGDVAAIINPKASYTVMLVGHADEICLRVCDATADGYLKVRTSGGVTPAMYLGHKVRIITPDKTIYGAVVSDEELYSEKMSARQLNIDIGAVSRSEALQLAPHGSCVIFDSDVRPLANGRITARGMDDRIGVYSVMQAAIKAGHASPAVKVVAVADVGEETGSTGAYYMASRYHPDLAIVVDVTFASDYPSSTAGTSGQVILGGGPVLDHGTRINKVINKRLEKVAEEMKISVQYEMTGGNTGTDADRLTFSGQGVPFALVSIPLRNMHSPAEVGALADIQATIDLLAGFISDIKDGIDCCPITKK